MPAPKIPYPPSPADVPEGLTDYPDSFTKQQNMLLAGLFVFLIMYIAAIILFGMVGVWCILTFAKYPAVKIIGIVLCGTFFLYLVKGFFKSAPTNKEMQAEITEDEHPVLFGFIHQLCDELGAPEPNKVFVAPDVNAACISRTSLLNLFVEPKRDLLIGLGLVNCTNLSEFKAVLAHEFGHFCHLGHTSSYTVVVKRIIFDLVEGEDWFDRFIEWNKRQENIFSVFGHVVGACLWFGRKILWWMLKTITLQDRAVSREQEFHADLVAVSAAGSDAATHGLLRARFGMQCFIQAVDDLATAIDHKLYTNDLYLHQDRAAAVVRRKKKEPELGLPPALDYLTAGKNIKVFDAEQDELEDEDDTPPMWRTHPSDADREENAKETFVAAPLDHRSPWILFNDVVDLKERLTYKFYRMVFRIPKNSDLADAVRVQEYIDNEHADTTYDPKYHGAYDDRPLEPGDLDELDTTIRTSPWNEDRMEKVYEKLFDGCREHAEAHADLHKELNSLNANVVGKPSPKVKKMIKEAEKKLDANWEWFKSFDRRVYLLHMQMASQVNKTLRQELFDRYRFQMTVQKFYQDARENFNKSDWYIGAYGAAMRGEINVPDDFGAEVIAVLRASWKILKNIVQEARETNLPAMKNFEEGERLADFILDGKLVPEPPLSELKGAWVQKLMTQLQGVKNRCFRLHFKSVGGILALQEKIAAEWVAAHAPVCAEVVEPETILGAEVIPAEVTVEGLVDEGPVIAAEVIPAEIAVESFIDALPIDDVAPPPVVPEKPHGAPMAAFVAPTPAPIAPPRPVAPVEVEPVAADVIDDPPPLISGPATPAAPAQPDPTFSLEALNARLKPAPSAAANMNLDLDAGTVAKPVAEPAKPDEPPPIPALTLQQADISPPETFSLEADAGKPRQISLSLDADEIAAAAKPKSASTTPAKVVSAEETFSLDADEPVVAEVLPDPEPAHSPERPDFGSGSSALMPALTDSNGAAKSGVRKRPVVKITMVRPGEKSPLAK